jgi:hypothetical protein
MRWEALRSVGGVALGLLLQGQPVTSDIPIDITSTGMKFTNYTIALELIDYIAIFNSSTPNYTHLKTRDFLVC